MPGLFVDARGGFMARRMAMRFAAALLGTSFIYTVSGVCANRLGAGSAVGGSGDQHLPDAEDLRSDNRACHLPKERRAYVRRWSVTEVDATGSGHPQGQPCARDLLHDGSNARANPSLVRRVLAEGHTIGNHSYSHPNFTTLSTAEQRASMENATKYISAAIEGGYKPCFFRPPYGSYNSTTINLARNRGMSVVKWSRNTKDWAAPSSLSTSFQKTIVANATSPLSSHPNVIMHDGGPSAYRQNTVDSLQRIITFYKSRGYKFTNPAGVQEPRLQIQ